MDNASIFNQSKDAYKALNQPLISEETIGYACFVLENISNEMRTRENIPIEEQKGGIVIPFPEFLMIRRF